MNEEKEFVTGVVLSGNNIAEKLSEFLKDNYHNGDFDEKILSKRETAINGVDYVRNGLVFPDGVGFEKEIPNFHIGLDVNNFNSFTGDAYVNAEYISKESPKFDYPQEWHEYFNGVSVAEALGVGYEVVERGKLNKNGEFEFTYSKAHPELVKKKKKLVDLSVEKKEKKIENVRK